MEEATTVNLADPLSGGLSEDEEEEERKKNILAVWWLSGSVLSWCFLAPLGVLFVMKTLQDEQYGCYNG